MTYGETLAWMFKQLPLYQRQGKTAFKKDLTNIKELATRLNHPEKKIKTIHVAGTNGKGSVCHLLASIFQEAGYKTGLYTSPHLKDFRERIKINGELVQEDFVINFIQRNQTFLEANGLSFFEMTVGMAFQCFAEEEVDIAIIETGLGGRLDSTNIIHPELSIITNIGLDHTKMLGDTLDKIAYEKAGIIKANTPALIGESNLLTTPVFKTKADTENAPLYFTDSAIDVTTYDCDLKGDYQKNNIRTTLKALTLLAQHNWTLPQAAIKKGIANAAKNTGLQGRYQTLGSAPKIICDTAHNKEGLAYVLAQLKKESYDHLHIVMGVVNDKDLTRILPLFPTEARYYFCKPGVPRGLDAELLAREAKKFQLSGRVISSPIDALNNAKSASSKRDLIFIGGSTFTVAEIL